MKFSEYNIIRNLNESSVIICNSLSGATCTIGKKMCSDLKNNIFNTDNEEEKQIIKKMIQAGIIVKDEYSEYNTYTYLSNLNRYRTDILDLRILPTEEFNCRCVYCYEDFNKGTMSKQVVKNVNLMLKKKIPLIKHLNIGWFGGEPLMALDEIIEISKNIQKIKEKSKLIYNSHITTNGYYLDRKVFATLLNLGIRSIQFTLDGYGSTHDQRKKLKNGGGTFDKIMANIESISQIKEKYSLSVRINVDKGNIDSIDQLILRLKKIFHKRKNFSFFFRATGDWGGDNELDSSNIISGEEANITLSELNHKYLGTNKYPVAAPSINSNQCYAALPYSYVIRSDGTLLKCTVFMDHEQNQVGEISDSGDIKIDFKKMARWTENDNRDKCQKCKLLPACSDNICPAKRIVNNTRNCSEMQSKINEYMDYCYNQNEKNMGAQINN
jgi:uncharacterized protein